LLDTNMQKSALLYQASKLNKNDKKELINANPWLPEYWNARSKYFDSKNMDNYESYEGTRKYYKPSEEILSKQEKYFSLPEKSQARKDFLNANQDLIDHWDKQQWARNQERLAMGLPPEEDAYSYSTSKKGSSRSSSRKGSRGSSRKRSFKKMAITDTSAPTKKASVSVPKSTYRLPRAGVSSVRVPRQQMKLTRPAMVGRAPRRRYKARKITY
jgi:hypothetical protein